jgi:hypothetical protein
VKPLNFDEFFDTTATLHSSGFSLGADGGYTRTPVAGTEFLCSFIPLSSSKAQFSGSAVIDATHYALTTEAVTVGNGNVLEVNGDQYEVVAFDAVSSPFAEYTCIYVRYINE